VKISSNHYFFPQLIIFRDDDLNIICIVLIMNLLGEISQFQFFSTYLSEIYLVLDNINSRLNTMKVKSVKFFFFSNLKIIFSLFKNIMKSSLKKSLITLEKIVKLEKFNFFVKSVILIIVVQEV